MLSVSSHNVDMPCHESGVSVVGIDEGSTEGEKCAGVCSKLTISYTLTHAAAYLVSSPDIQFFARALQPCRKIGSGHVHW